MTEDNGDFGDFLSQKAERMRRLADLERLSIGDISRDEFDQLYPGYLEETQSWTFKEITRIAPTLCDIERKVVSLRFGLSDGILHTLDEISQKEGVDLFQIREIEGSLMSKIRHPSRSLSLTDHLSDEKVQYMNIKVSELNNYRSMIPSFWLNSEILFGMLIDEGVCRFLKSPINSLVGRIEIDKDFVKSHFVPQYKCDFIPENLEFDSIYEQIANGYFTWSKELCFLIDIAEQTWSQSTGDWEDPILWIEKPKLAIALYAFLTESAPIDVAESYFFSCPQENLLSSLISFDLRSQLHVHDLIQFLNAEQNLDVSVRSALLNSSLFRDELEAMNRNSPEDSLRFFVHDLVVQILQMTYFSTLAHKDSL